MFITGTNEIDTVRPTIMTDYTAMITMWADALERSRPADIKGLKMHEQSVNPQVSAGLSLDICTL